MIGIIGKKLGMTQIFNEQGQQIPCTVVEATPNAVTKLLTTEAAGFQSVELGYGEQKLSRENKKGEKTPRGRRANKAVVGHAVKAGLSTAPKVLRSFRLDDGPKSVEVPTYNLGDKVTVDIFAPGVGVPTIWNSRSGYVRSSVAAAASSVSWFFSGRRLATVMNRRTRPAGLGAAKAARSTPLGITAIDAGPSPSRSRIRCAAGEFATTLVAHR